MIYYLLLLRSFNGLKTPVFYAAPLKAVTGFGPLPKSGSNAQ
jgi:hypothetical protein